MVHTGHWKQAGPADGDLCIGLSELCSDNGAQRHFATPDLVSSMDIPQGPLSESCFLSPVSLELQGSSPGFQWGTGGSPSCHSNPTCTCFYQLHMHEAEAFLCDPSNQNGTSASFQVECSPETSPAAILSHQDFGSLLNMLPVQHHFLTQWRYIHTKIVDLYNMLRDCSSRTLKKKSTIMKWIWLELFDM